MVSFFALTAAVLVAVIATCQGQGQDATLTPNALGARVVDAAVDRIRSKYVCGFVWEDIYIYIYI